MKFTSLTFALSYVVASTVEPKEYSEAPLKNFFWGVATSAYQVEGAAASYGRSPSIWDTFAQIPGKILDGSNASVAVDQYHLYEQDFQMLKNKGGQAYRMSLSWSRILPEAKAGSPVNEEAIEHYHKVFDSLLEKGIEPWVTLYHWDLPQVLMDAYGGFLDEEQFVRDFTYYAKVVFENFGSKVKNWATFNEPLIICKLGYGVGVFAPGRCSDRSRCPEGDSSREIWTCGHNLLLAHGSAVQEYRKSQNGKITLVVNCDWAEPKTDSKADKAAALRALDFSLHWFADVVQFGDYPKTMRKLLGNRLPKFTAEQSAMLKGSTDLFGLNHYTTSYVSNVEGPIDINDMDGLTKSDKVDANGEPVGIKGQPGWLYNVPWGFKKLLLHIKERYGNPELVITENGFAPAGEGEGSLKSIINDVGRVDYYKGYLASLVECVKDHGQNIVGYFAWSMVDNFEWADGYTVRFGITYVDFKTQARIPKASFKFLSKFFKENIQQ